jgi:DNA-binding NarL/FixJ family response regulator
MAQEFKVLIVDDSPTVRYEVRLLLKKININVVEVVNKLGLFIKIEEYGKLVDLIIMDLTLQYENGWDLIEELKKVDKYKNIPVLVLTEHADRENVLKARKYDVSGYLRKPIQKQEFLSRITSILGIDAEKINKVDE